MGSRTVDISYQKTPPHAARDATDSVFIGPVLIKLQNISLRLYADDAVLSVTFPLQILTSSQS